MNRRGTTADAYDSPNCIWRTGEAMVFAEKQGYGAVLCLDERELGSRGGIRKPARVAQITTDTWSEMRSTFQALGFNAPGRAPKRESNG